MGAEGRKWQEVVERHFGFLAEFGFGRPDVDDSTFWATSVTYRTDVVGLKVSRSNEFMRSEVQLIRLVDGEVPPYPIWITSEPINWILLDTVLEARDPGRLHEASALSGLDKDSIARQLTFWADALQAVAPDFLRGDVAAIEEGEAIVRERVRQNPQEIVAWIPDDAPPGAEADEIEKLSLEVPPVVGVKARRYRRGRHSDK